MKTHLLAIFSLMILMTACGGSDASSTDSASSDTPEATSASSGVAELTIEGNDMMQYNLKSLEVTAGQKVKLTLKHVGQMPVEAMGHNWVLLAQGTDKADFATKAIAAKDNDYIPASEASKVIAHTKMIGGGEEVTIEFDAPAAGTYDFICTFPGHYALMNGTLTVK